MRFKWFFRMPHSSGGSRGSEELSELLQDVRGIFEKGVIPNEAPRVFKGVLGSLKN